MYSKTSLYAKLPALDSNCCDMYCTQARTFVETLLFTPEAPVEAALSFSDLMQFTRLTGTSSLLY